MPKIDIFLSCYQGERYVHAAITSVLNQTESDFLLYVVDDCSDDKTWNVINNFRDDRIVARRNQKNLGLFHNLNTLAALSTARWIKLMGQDDLLLDNCLERGLEFAKANPSVGCFWCYDQQIDENDHVVSTGPVDHITEVMGTDRADKDALAWGCLSSNITNIFLRRDSLQKVGPFREDIMSADFDMMSRIQAFYDVGRFTNVLVRVRSHSKQWSRDLKQMENHVNGNLQVFSGILKRSVSERNSISTEEAEALLLERFARCEFDWLIRAFANNLDFAAASRSVIEMKKIVPIKSVFAKWFNFRAGRLLALLRANKYVAR